MRRTFYNWIWAPVVALGLLYAMAAAAFSYGRWTVASQFADWIRKGDE
jgi:hypothetical protein